MPQVIAARPNVAKQLHMPAQSGSSRVLQRMRRGYDRASYDALVAHVRQKLPQVPSLPEFDTMLAL